MTSNFDVCEMGSKVKFLLKGLHSHDSFENKQMKCICCDCCIDGIVVSKMESGVILHIDQLSLQFEMNKSQFERFVLTRENTTFIHLTCDYISKLRTSRVDSEQKFCELLVSLFTTSTEFSVTQLTDRAIIEHKRIVSVVSFDEHDSSLQDDSSDFEVSDDEECINLSTETQSNSSFSSGRFSYQSAHCRLDHSLNLYDEDFEQVLDRTLPTIVDDECRAAGSILDGMRVAATPNHQYAAELLSAFSESQTNVPTSPKKVSTRRGMTPSAVFSEETSDTKDAKRVKGPPTDRKKASTDASGVLMDWLISHQAHPYPTASEKKLLSTRTGLTTQQVNHWMSNNRKRKLVKLISNRQKPESKVERAFLEEVGKRRQQREKNEEDDEMV